MPWEFCWRFWVLAHFHRRLLLVSRSVPISESQLRNQKRAPGCSGFTGDYISSYIGITSSTMKQGSLSNNINNQDSMECIRPGVFFHVFRIRDSLEKRRGVSSRGHRDLCFCCEKTRKPYPYHPCMVYLPTFVWFSWLTEAYTSPMDGMGYSCKEESPQTQKSWTANPWKSKI